MPQEEEEIVAKEKKKLTCSKCNQELKFITRNGKRISKHSGRECRFSQVATLVES